MELERPRIRGARELGFESRVLGRGVARTHALEALIILGFLRGLSVRDVEALLEEALGEQVDRQVDRRPDLPGHARALPALVSAPASTSTTSSTATWTRSTSSCAPTTSPPRACWSPGASRWRARRSCSGCSSARRESYESWLDFGRDLQQRGVRAPALIIADGAPGIWKATRELWPRAIEQRCSVHALRNIDRRSCPSGCIARSRRATGPCSTRRPPPATRRPGCSRSPATTGRAYPSAMRVIDEHVDQLVAHLRFPLEHRKRITQHEPARAHLRRGPPPHQDHRPLPRRDHRRCR